MKKYFILILFLFFFSINWVYADTDWKVGTLTCNYVKGNDKIEITYYNVGAALGDAEVYYRIRYQQNNKTYCYTDGWVSKCTDINDDTLWDTLGLVNFDSISTAKNQKFYGVKNRLVRRAYNEEANFNEVELCSKAVFIEKYNSQDMIYACETSDTVKDNNKTECNYSSADLFTLNGKTIGINSHAGANDTDYTNSYNEARTDQEKYCNTSSSDYDLDLCNKATSDVETTINAATESGTSEELLEQNFAKLNVNISLDFNTSDDCSSFLGSTAHKENPDPAYYLQFTFNLIKYAAIVLLFVMTVVEFAKATTSNNQDAMKKALQNTIKRVIIAIIIFFLPILIKFILTVLGVYSPSTCGIS